MEIVISFDDTGSMASVRKQVKMKIKEFLDEVFQVFDNLKVGVIIHNDYCDRDTIQHLDLTSDKQTIISFINRDSSQGGGDSDECYELAINYAYNRFSWSSDKRVLVLIGDCEPHEKGYKYRDFKNELDWKTEVKNCVGAGVNILPIQCLNRWDSTNFYNYLANEGGLQVKLELSQFAHITQYLTAFAYSQVDKLNQYEDSQAEFKTNLNFKNMFEGLKTKRTYEYIDKTERRSPYSYSSPSRSAKRRTITDDGAPIENDLSKFQIMDVDKPIVIKDFVELAGAVFQVGKGFYQLVTPELIQEKKEVIFVDKLTGEVICDTRKCRELLGLPYGTKGKVSPKKLDICKKYNVFIQSTSYNRKLDGNTKFLYEMEHK